MTRTVDNSQDLLDSRDVIEYIESLESDLESAETEEEKADILAELEPLKALADEASGSPDWQYGETLIRDSYFRDYVEEMAEDCCEMSKAQDWPFRHIDWDAAAEELKQDYMCVDFDGIEYWIRA